MLKAFKANFILKKLSAQPKFPLIVSGLLLNNHLKKNFSLARLFEQRYFLRIINDKDIEELTKKYKTEVEQAQNVHLDIRDNVLEDDKFKELFNVLANTKKEEFHLDLSNAKLDDEKISSITQCFGKWDLKNLSLHMSNINFTNKQFDHLIDSLEKMKSLRYLHLEMENVNLNTQRKKRIENLINNLKGLTHVSINLRNNNITEEDAKEISRLLDRFDVRHFFF